jgi:hypothetical protein
MRASTTHCLSILSSATLYKTWQAGLDHTLPGYPSFCHPSNTWHAGLDHTLPEYPFFCHPSQNMACGPRLHTARVSFLLPPFTKHGMRASTAHCHIILSLVQHMHTLHTSHNHSSLQAVLLTGPFSCGIDCELDDQVRGSHSNVVGNRNTILTVKTT